LAVVELEVLFSPRHFAVGYGQSAAGGATHAPGPKYAGSCIYVSNCHTLDPVFHIVKVSYVANPLIPLQ